MTKVIKAGWFVSLSDGFAHYCELKEGSLLYSAGFGDILTVERLDFTSDGAHCFWCEKIRAANERKRAENEQRKTERKDARRVEISEERDDAPLVAKSPRGKPKRERLSVGGEDDQPQVEPGAPALPGVSSDTGHTEQDAQAPELDNEPPVESDTQ